MWNGARDKGSRISPIKILFAGFSAVTSTSAWRSRCENVDQMAETFRAMPEIPGDLKNICKGLDWRQEIFPIDPSTIQP